MKKYGIENFNFEIVEKVDGDLDKLTEREAYWILKYNSIEDGYNMVLPTDSNPMMNEEIYKKHNKIMKRDKVRNKISKTMKELRKDGNFEESHLKKISEALKGNTNGKRTAVKLYTRLGEFVGEFETCVEAGEYIRKETGNDNIVGSHIASRLANGHRTAYGYVIKYADEGAEAIETPLFDGLY